MHLNTLTLCNLLYWGCGTYTFVIFLSLVYGLDQRQILLRQLQKTNLVLRKTLSINHTHSSRAQNQHKLIRSRCSGSRYNFQEECCTLGKTQRLFSTCHISRRSQPAMAVRWCLTSDQKPLNSILHSVLLSWRFAFARGPLHR